MRLRRVRSRHLVSQKGQAFLLIIAIVAVFLLGVLGVATDYTQVWAHRQIAQAAADAACQAGAADLFLNGTDPSASTTLGFDYTWIGTAYDCSTHATSSPCVYAAHNGYSGSNVAITFPSSVPGVDLTGFGSIAHPFIKVRITDPVALSFSKILSSTGTVNMAASATCGLSPVSVPIPLVILQQTEPGTLSLNGSPAVQIIGGPNRAIQVDSSSSTAVSVGSGTVNLTLAGPAGGGADFGTFGGPTTQPGGVTLGTGKWVQPSLPLGDPWVTIAEPAVPSTTGKSRPVGFTVNGCPDPNGCVEFTAGDYSGACATGNVPYLNVNSEPNGCLIIPITLNVNDRSKNHDYLTLGEVILPGNNNPGKYGFKVTTTGHTVNTNNGSFPTAPAVPAGPNWPQTTGATQTDGTVTWTNIGPLAGGSLSTAIFDPGVYYVGVEGLQLGSGSTVRPSTATGESVSGTSVGGTTFFFSHAAGSGQNKGTINVDANSGKSSACTAASVGSGTPNGCVVSYKPDGTNSSVALGSVPSRGLQCPAAGSPSIPTQVPATIDGNILIGPCTGPSPGQTQNYGDSAGQNRGFLFFQKHSVPANPSWSGGGQFLLSGFMYFHSSSTGTSCGSTTTCLSLSGNSGAGAFTLGNVVADEISLGGSSGVKMILNPASTFKILKPQLLQ